MIQINSKKLTKFLKRFDDPLEYVIRDCFTTRFLLTFLAFMIISSIIYPKIVFLYEHLNIVIIGAPITYLLGKVLSVLYFKSHKVNRLLLSAKSDNKSDLEIYKLIVLLQELNCLSNSEIKILDNILENYPELRI